MPNFKSLKDFVYDYISEQISKGDLEPNEKIYENNICKELNISRTPVREAMIQLATEGYIESIPRRGFVVRKLDEKEAEDIYEILGILDGFVARQVCGELTEKDFSDMDFYIGSMDLATKAENYDMYYKQQEQFHDTYISKSSNESLKQMIYQVKKKFLKRSYGIPKGVSTEKTLLDTNAEHREMLELFKKGDAIGIETYLREVHWENSKAFMETIK